MNFCVWVRYQYLIILEYDIDNFEYDINTYLLAWGILAMDQWASADIVDVD